MKAVAKCLQAGEPRGERYYPPDLPRHERLLGRSDRQSIIRNSRAVKVGPLSVHVMPYERWCLAILLMRGIKPAVARNRIKRVLREAYRHAKVSISIPHAVVFCVSCPEPMISCHAITKTIVDQCSEKPN